MVRRALHATEPEAREAELRALDTFLAGKLGVEGGQERQERQERAPRERSDDPLSHVLGEAVPAHRDARLNAIDAFVAAHPDRVDDVAFAAVRSQLKAAGNEVPAPWLAGVIARALITSKASRTRQALGEIRKAGGAVSTAFLDPMFDRLVRVGRAAAGAGATYVGLRRGVLARVEPAERKLWTLRLSSGDREVIVAAAAPDVAPDAALSAQLAARLGELSPAWVLLAPGEANAPLREAATSAGMTAFDHDPGDGAILAAVGLAEGDRPVRREDGLGSVVSAILDGDVPGADRVAEILKEGPRGWKVIQSVERGLSPSTTDVDARVAALLAGVDATAGDDRPIPEGTTLGVRVAARGGAETRKVVALPRYGGPGVDALVDVAAAVVGAGWEVGRVLRGPTRRERDTRPVLATLADELDGVWRLLVRKGAIKAEVWYIAHLSASGRAGVAQMLADDGARVVVLPIDPELLAWYAGLGGSSAIGWTGSEGAEVAAELGRLAPEAAAQA